MRFARVACTIAVVLLILVAGAVVTAAAFGERLLAAGIEKAGPAMIGREVRVGGVAIDWGRFTAVAATDLTVADAPWSPNPTMLRARRTELTVDLLDLLRLRFSPVRLGLEQPVLHLARDEQGRWNLPQAGGGDGDASGGRAQPGLAGLREIEIEDGELTVDDLASPGVEGRIAGFSARMPRPEDGIEFRGTASRDGGTAVAFSGRAGSPAELLRSGEDGADPYPVRLTVGPETSRLSADGHLARPFDLAGVDLRIQAQGDDLAPLLAAFTGTEAPTTPAFHLTARLTDTERGWDLRDIEARLGESEVRGETAVSFEPRQRPLLSFDLAAPRLVPSDLGWLSSVGGGGSGAPSGPLLDSRLPTAWLRRADAKGDLRVERLDGLATEPAELRLGLELKDGRLHLEPLRLALAGGAAEGTATVDAADGAPPRVALRADASDLRIGPLLAALGVGKVTGTLASGSIDLRGQGTTPREVAAGLDGAVRFRVTDGTVGVPDLVYLSMGLVQVLGFVMGGGGGGSDAATATPVTCAVGDLPVRGGVLHAERLVVLIPRIAIVAKGTIRLAEATAQITLTPQPLDEALLRVLVPVEISGPLASPEVTKHPEFRAGPRQETTADPCGKEADRR